MLIFNSMILRSKLSKLTTHNKTKSLLIGLHKIAIGAQPQPVREHQTCEYA